MKKWIRNGWRGKKYIKRDKRQNVHAHSELTWSDSWMKSETKHDMNISAVAWLLVERVRAHGITIARSLAPEDCNFCCIYLLNAQCTHADTHSANTWRDKIFTHRLMPAAACISNCLFIYYTYHIMNRLCSECRFTICSRNAFSSHNHSGQNVRTMHNSTAVEWIRQRESHRDRS